MLSCAGCPNLLTTAASDAIVKVWDIRAGKAQHTVIPQSRDSDENLELYCALVGVGGSNFVFMNSLEGIRGYNLRMRRPLYELSTGCSEVQALELDQTSESLELSSSATYHTTHATTPMRSGTTTSIQTKKKKGRTRSGPATCFTARPAFPSAGTTVVVR